MTATSPTLVESEVVHGTLVCGRLQDKDALAKSAQCPHSHLEWQFSRRKRRQRLESKRCYGVPNGIRTRLDQGTRDAFGAGPLPYSSAWMAARLSGSVLAR